MYLSVGRYRGIDTKTGDGVCLGEIAYKVIAESSERECGTTGGLPDLTDIAPGT